ncbi:hypothetical protein LIER_30630 [Lithospermum erythrorhizon]|uniref:Transposase (putative) gypsy type domain-containing protein n=1 Tax=Lithospermum erythrorhizon TaxID=34254 RepID=A0AAV3RTK6_LITER
MRIPLAGETPDTPLEEAYTPVFLEFFNYGLRLRASPFVNSLISAIGRAFGQLGPFAWVVVTTFQVGCLSVGIMPSVNLFSKIFNVVHQGVLTYFHIRSGVKNMLYSQPGKIPHRPIVQEEPALNLQEEAPEAHERIEALMLEKPLEEPLDSSPVQYI